MTSEPSIATLDTILTPKEQSFFVGHATAVTTLLESWSSGKAPNGWLISGPKGIGKATLAYRFARHILTGQRFADMDVPEHHPVFMRIKNGSHSDVLALETGYDEATGKTSKEISVDDARKIAGFLRLTASETPYRIVIIDSVDEMNHNSANSILKLLEEPPQHALMLLVSHAPGSILPTIRSRCRHLKLNALPASEANTVLNRLAPQLSLPETATLLQLADYSPGIALNLAQNNGAALYQSVLAFLNTALQPDTKAMHRLGEEVSNAQEPEQWRCFAYILSWCITRIIRFKSVPYAVSELSGIEQQLVNCAIAKYPLEKLFEIWEKMEHLINVTENRSLDKKAAIITLHERLRA